MEFQLLAGGAVLEHQRPLALLGPPPEGGTPRICKTKGGAFASLSTPGYTETEPITLKIDTSGIPC